MIGEGNPPLVSRPPGTGSTERLILFTRYPVPGKAKSRLMPALGAEGCAALQRRLTLRTVRCAEKFCVAHSVDLEIQFEGATELTVSHWLGDRFGFVQQFNGDLGARMDRALEKAFCEGAKATIIIGADCPELSAEILFEAFARLRKDPVVLGPANDGGYYLIGLQRPIPELFRGVPWGTDEVLSESLRILKSTGTKTALLKPLNDIDRPEDLSIWRRLIAAEEQDLSQVSVIIPALNEGDLIGATVDSASQGNPKEILVVDGGSRDNTAQSASAAGAQILSSKPGRARQMNSGASRAVGNVLLFLHADTSLPAEYAKLASSTLRSSEVACGAFSFQIAARFPGRRFIELSTNIRSRRLQMPYGDQALFMRRSVFEELGGFADLPILEDYDMVRRLRRKGRVVTLRQAASTSGRRWRRLGVLRATFINQCVLMGYRLGWPTQKLARIYAPGFFRTIPKAGTVPRTPFFL